MDTHFLVNGLQYCREGCLPHIHCGPITIPTEHQTSCRSCSQSGLQCEESEVNGGEGVEGGHFLLYISALDEPHCRQGEKKLLHAKCIVSNTAIKKLLYCRMINF